MTLEPRALPVAELLDLVRRWLTLREQELPLLRRLEAALEAMLEERRSSTPLAPDTAGLSRQEELLRDLLRSFGPAAGGELPADTETAVEAERATEPVSDPPPQVEVPTTETIGSAAGPSLPDAGPSRFYLLVDQGDGWMAFPWERITRVIATESPEAAPYEICYRVGAEERGLLVAEVGRIVAGAAVDLAAPRGRFQFDREREPAAEMTSQEALASIAPSEQQVTEATATKEVVDSEVDDEPLVPIAMQHVLSVELDAGAIGIGTEAVEVGANGTEHAPQTDRVATADHAGVALLAVRYLPARVALARALRGHGWQVVEEPDPTDARRRTAVLRPGLICVELSDSGDSRGAGTEEIAELGASGCPLYVVASRHRVDDGRISADVPRLLHPFTEAELDALPPPPSRPRA